MFKITDSFVNLGFNGLVSKTFKRYYPDRLETLRNSVQGVEFQTPQGPRFPKAEEMGRHAIIPFLKGAETGNTIYVGGNKAEPADSRLMLPYELDRSQVASWLDMYSDDTLLVDRFISENNKLRGRAEYTPRDSDYAGHFSGRFGKYQMYKGVMMAEFAAQGLALIFRGLEPGERPDDPNAIGDREMLGYYDTLPRMRVSRMVIPGDTMVFAGEITAMSAKNLKGRGIITVGDEVIAEPKNLVLGIAPAGALGREYEKVVARREKTRLSL